MGKTNAVRSIRKKTTEVVVFGDFQVPTPLKRVTYNSIVRHKRTHILLIAPGHHLYSVGMGCKSIYMEVPNLKSGGDGACLRSAPGYGHRK